MSTELTITGNEQARLETCEAVINAGRQTFIDVGNALSEIRDSRLYRDQYGDFDTYCSERWGFSKTQANRLIGAADVALNLAPIGVTPTCEAQVRPLTKLETPEEQREVYQTAAAKSPDGIPTAKAIEVEVEVVQSARPSRRTPRRTKFEAGRCATWACARLSEISDYDAPGMRAAFDTVTDYMMKRLRRIDSKREAPEDAPPRARGTNKNWIELQGLVEEVQAIVAKMELLTVDIQHVHHAKQLTAALGRQFIELEKRQ